MTAEIAVALLRLFMPAYRWTIDTDWRGDVTISARQEWL